MWNNYPFGLNLFYGFDCLTCVWDSGNPKCVVHWFSCSSSGGGLEQGKGFKALAVGSSGLGIIKKGGLN